MGVQKHGFRHENLTGQSLDLIEDIQRQENTRKLFNECRKLIPESEYGCVAFLADKKTFKGICADMEHDELLKKAGGPADQYLIGLLFQEDEKLSLLLYAPSYSLRDYPDYPLASARATLQDFTRAMTKSGLKEDSKLIIISKPDKSAKIPSFNEIIPDSGSQKTSGTRAISLREFNSILFD
jgi:hypothetical protein